MERRIEEYVWNMTKRNKFALKTRWLETLEIYDYK